MVAVARAFRGHAALKTLDLRGNDDSARELDVGMLNAIMDEAGAGDVEEAPRLGGGVEVLL